MDFREAFIGICHVLTWTALMQSYTFRVGLNIIKQYNVEHSWIVIKYLMLVADNYDF